MYLFRYESIELVSRSGSREKQSYCMGAEDLFLNHHMCVVVVDPGDEQGGKAPLLAPQGGYRHTPATALPP